MAALLLAQLLRTTTILSVTAMVVFLVLRGMRFRSPRLHRIAWLLVLVSGWLFMRVPIVVPWFDAPPPVARRVEFPIGVPTELAHAGAASVPLPNEISHPAAKPIGSPPSAAHRPSLLSWSMVGVIGWALGMAVFVARWLFGYIRFLRNLPIGTAPLSEWQKQWLDLIAEHRVRRPVRLCITRDAGPLICRAWGEYRLLVPEALWRELSPAERAAILEHELAHVARGDLFKSLLARILALPHWFNPLAWWAVRHFDECGEWACDDAVRRRGHREATSYARVLLRLGHAASPGYGAAIGGRRLSTRVQRLITGPPWEDSTMKKSILIAAMVVLFVGGAIEWHLGVRQSRARAEQQGAPARDAKAAQPQDVASPEVDAALLQNLAEAAEGGYMAWEASYKAGTAVAADCYIWSRRWVEAERALAENKEEELAALRRHRDRMQQLFSKVEALWRNGIRGGEETQYFAAKFYLAEAEVWIALLDRNIERARYLRRHLNKEDGSKN
ncbi:MAG TPA: M56 family metallopeptidase [Pirellulales bacterium]|nr:M56 family metallopeptidase [Pirellulales bacterium]